MPKRYAHVEMIIPGDKIIDAMEFAEHAGALKGTVHVHPVKHGGEDEQNGTLKRAPTSLEFVNDYVARHATVNSKEMIPLAREVGISGSAVHAQLRKLTLNKVLKHVGPGEYIRREGKMPTPTKAKPAASRRTTNPAPGESLGERITTFIQKKQNGSGEGVSMMDIRQAATDAGFAPTSVNTVITGLLKNKSIKRLSKGMYRAQ